MPKANSPAWQHLQQQSASARDDVHREIIQKGWFNNSSVQTSSGSLYSSKPEQQDSPTAQAESDIQTPEAIEPKPTGELYADSREGEATASDLYGEASAEEDLSEEVTSEDLYGEPSQDQDIEISDLYGETPDQGEEPEQGIEP